MGYFDAAIRQKTLAHHGILGQKWGVRRFQNKDGTLTPEGRRHLGQLESAKKQYKSNKKIANAYRMIGYYDEKTEKAMEKSKNEMTFRKEQLATDKARYEIANRDKVSKREQTLIDKYTKNGMSKEDAELKAYKQAKLEKTLAIAGAVTIAAATAYGLKKYHDYSTDVILKAGDTKFKRIANNSSTELHDTFYAAFGKSDAKKYVGLYGSQINATNPYANIYQKTIDITSDMKIASDKNAKNIMAKTLSNASSDEKRDVVEILSATRAAFAMGGGAKQTVVMTKAINDINKGKYDTKSVYDSMNFIMGGTSGGKTSVVKNFKEALKNEGYSGVNDRNDASYSGYKAKTARIIVDNSKVKVSDVRYVEDSEVAKETNKFLIKELAKATAGVVVASKVYSEVKSKRSNDKIVNNYKKEHPDSKLSREQILENYYGGK